MLLLDSHVVLWWLLDPDRLGQAMIDEIGRAGDRVYVSTASTWEIEIKRHARRLELPTGIASQIDAEGFTHLPIQSHHAEAAAELPMHHRDPFDRMLVAQAQIERLTLVTADARITQYDVAVVAP